MSSKNRTVVGEFLDNEFGGGTAFGLFIFVLLAMVLGVGIDFTNTWRNRTHLTATADIAAHAGAVAMAKGATVDEATDIIKDSVAANMPSSLFGGVLDAENDITFATYDPDASAFTSYGSSDPNSVIVELYRDQGHGNPVANYLLQFVGIPIIELNAISASVADRSGLCGHSDGIYAKDTVTISSQADVGAEFCIHSEEDVWLPQQNLFRPGSMVTMPDLTDCKSKCVDSANPGINAVEAHMVLGDFGARITNTYDMFAGSMGTTGGKYDFFHNDLDDDYDPVISLGDTTQLVADLGLKSTPVLGDVIDMTKAEFESFPELPSGLVYEVSCPSNGSGKNTEIVFSGTSAKMDGSVLLTNCLLEFDSGSSIKSSVVITTRETNNAAISAHNNVTIGDPTQGCDSTERSFIMSKSKVSVPSEFVMSNVTMIVDDDVNIASATSSGATSYGFAIYASGEVKIASQHKFRSCGDSYMGDMTPEGKILRLVVPPVI